MVNPMWKDATSYSQGQRGKIEPKSWETEIEGFRIFVSCGHLGYPESWVMSCRGMDIDTHYLGASEGVSAEDAQGKALEVVKKIASDRIAKLQAFMGFSAS